MDLTEEEIRQIVHERYKAKCKEVKELKAEVERLKADNRIWVIEVENLRRALDMYKRGVRAAALRSGNW